MAQLLRSVFAFYLRYVSSYGTITAEIDSAGGFIMKRKFAAFIIAVALCLSFVGCMGNGDNGNAISVTTSVTESSAICEIPGDVSEATPALYKVTDGDGNILWLFGSVHAGRDSFYPLPDYVMDAFESSDALAVEFNITEFENDQSAMIGILTSLCYTDGTTIKDHLDEDTYSKAVKVLEDGGYYNALLDYYIPSLWASFVDDCLYGKLGVDMDSGVDKHLIALANDTGKEILDIESAEYQFEMLADYSPELQEYLLKSSLESYDDQDAVKEELGRMLDLWASGDVAAFSEYLESEDDDVTDEEELRLYEEYNDSMIVVRNDNMTDYAEDALRSGKEVFICVGAAHIFGEGGIADQLAGLGYTVEQVK